MSSEKRTWLVTGCSTGLGRALAGELIEQGQRVFATAREPNRLSELVSGHSNATALKLDVTSAEDIAAAVTAIELAGGVDVLVNNAGYGYRAAVEEGEDERVANLFATNFFGAVSMIKAVLPACVRGTAAPSSTSPPSPRPWRCPAPATTQRRNSLWRACPMRFGASSNGSVSEC
jgi:NAD(P)-dependent dehydrogenase (short-subunit alcohol dehydrogenase family)